MSSKRVTVCEKCFSLFDVPLELTVLTQLGVKNESLVSQDNMSETFLVSYFPVKDIHFSKCLARVSWSFFIAFPLTYYRILLVPMKMVSRGLPGELSLRGDAPIQKKAQNILQLHGVLLRDHPYLC